jgi:dolichol kinase
MQQEINKYNLGRKVIHISLGFALCVLYFYKVLPLWSYYAIFFAGLSLSLILKSGKKVPLISRMLRDLDKDNYFPAHGLVFFVLGFIILLTLVTLFKLPEIYLILPIMILTFADPASFFAGKLIGGPKLPFNREKTVAGTIGGMATAALVVYEFKSAPKALLIGVVAMTMDLTSFRIGKIEIDDNLLIPLAAFIMMLILR